MDKRIIIIVLFFIFLPVFITASVTNQTAKEKVISKETIEFWKKTLNYGTTGQKIAIFKSIREKESKEILPVIERRLTEEDNIDLKKEIFNTLIALSNNSAVPYLMQIIKNKDSSEELILFAFHSLGSINYYNAGLEIIGYIDSPNIIIQETALRALGELEYKEAVPILIKKLEDKPSQRMKSELIVALVNIKSKKSQDILISILTNKRETEFNKKLAVTGLGYINNKKSYTILSKMINDPDIKDEKMIIRLLDAFKNFGDDRSVNILIRYLKEDNPVFRLHAAKSLGHLKAKNAMNILEYKKEYDPDENVRKAAEKSLNLITGKEEEEKEVFVKTEDIKKKPAAVKPKEPHDL